MNQSSVSVLPEISHFDCFAGVWVRAVLQSDTNITLFASECPRRRLYEAWVLPELAEFFTPGELTKMCLNSLAELRDQLDPNTASSTRTFSDCKRQIDLVSDLAPELVDTKVHFAYIVTLVDGGGFIRIVFGDARSMRDFEQAGFGLEPEGE